MKYSAFTLIELLIVVAIIGILAAIAVPNFLNAQARAKIAGAQADERSIGTAIESYRVDYNNAPRSYTGGCYAGDGMCEGNMMSRFKRISQLTTPVPYMNSVPEDKFNRMDIQTAGGGPHNTYPYWEPNMADRYRTPSLLGRHFKDQGSPNDLWALMSFGPDGDFEAAGGGDLAPFEVSNGLQSNGDIMRFGY